MNAGATFARSVVAEWHRLWTVRSSWLLASVLAVVAGGLATIVSVELADSAEPGGSPWVIAQMLGLLALFGLIVLSALGTTADHVTRNIVPTLQWTPRRRVLLAARTGVVAGTSTVLGLAVLVAASAIVWALVPDLRFFSSEGAQALRAGAVVFATGALLTVGLGLLTRSTAATLSATFALMLVLPLVLQLAPFDWVTRVIELLPGAGALYLLVGEGPGDTEPTTLSASLTLCGWALGALAAGAWRLVRTDADQ
jgi:ABC-2 type transport system permease protein